MLAALAFAAPDFAVRLWNALPDDKGNVVVSPTSIEACLGLLIPAVGPTAKAPLAKTLGTTTAGLAKYETGLQKRLHDLVEGGEATVANAGFFAETPRPTYVAAIQKGYGATAERLTGVEQVNAWVKAKTKDRIPKLFEKLNRQTSAVLVNAVTFDGDWTTAFDANGTRKTDFHAPSGTRPVETMARNDFTLPYAQGKGFRMIQLAYQGGRYRMAILLPDAGDPAPLLRNDAWRRAASSDTSVNLTLPKFTARSEPKVEEALKTMGLAPLFDQIDVSLALPNGAHERISEIVHKTYVKVDEKGTQAAAATGIAMARTMYRPKPSVAFHVDRPFAFVIQRVETGEILFQGVIREP